MDGIFSLKTSIPSIILGEQLIGLHEHSLKPREVEKDLQDMFFSINESL